ncbi:hypothetical protein SAMD00023353_4500680 [Rosellinia necatrix]|uniref:Uncharacterized protein n=1 Tax=Rosellinia necatrix TaxID=77044 RepID=A0A1W2TQ03_ROSNE|nr:hypothetical protein SAMD00023353_4500680 [Rosellinia necatrix]
MVQFFSNWELWEQLTFVLAAGIVTVFFIGWIKLWWMQRLLKKHALLDEEKRVRQMELRKSGLPVGRKVDIPFGVRAIQSGVEVEGIWISRPVTPMEVRDSGRASSATIDIDSEPRPEDKGKGVLGGVIKPATTAAEAEPTPKPSSQRSPVVSYFDQGIRPDVGGSKLLGPQTAHPQPHFLQRPSNDNTRGPRHFHAAPHAAPQAEGAAPRHRIETYIPTSSSSTVNSSPSPLVGPIGDRVSVSSEEELSLSSPRFPADIRGGAYRSPFEDSESSSSAGPSRSQGKYCSRVRAETRGDSFEFSEAGRAPSPGHQSTPRPSLASTRPTPIRTYTNQRENMSSRVVNMGFEVLPAGTFGRLSGESQSHTPGLAR